MRMNMRESGVEQQADESKKCNRNDIQGWEKNTDLWFADNSNDDDDAATPIERCRCIFLCTYASGTYSNRRFIFKTLMTMMRIIFACESIIHSFIHWFISANICTCFFLLWKLYNRLRWLLYITRGRSPCGCGCWVHERIHRIWSIRNEQASRSKTMVWIKYEMNIEIRDDCQAAATIVCMRHNWYKQWDKMLWGWRKSEVHLMKVHTQSDSVRFDKIYW